MYSAPASPNPTTRRRLPIHEACLPPLPIPVPLLFDGLPGALSGCDRVGEYLPLADISGLGRSVSPSTCNVGKLVCAVVKLLDVLPALLGAGGCLYPSGLSAVLGAVELITAAENGLMALAIKPLNELFRPCELDPEREMDMLETAILPSLRLLPVRPLSSSADTELTLLAAMSCALLVGEIRPVLEWYRAWELRRTSAAAQSETHSCTSLCRDSAGLSRASGVLTFRGSLRYEDGFAGGSLNGSE